MYYVQSQSTHVGQRRSRCNRWRVRRFGSVRLDKGMGRTGDPPQPQSRGSRRQAGFLAELAGTWEGSGFNLIGRPDKQGNSAVFLELNQTFETLSFIPVSSSIPNRGF